MFRMLVVAVIFVGLFDLFLNTMIEDVNNAKLAKYNLESKELFYLIKNSTGKTPCFNPNIVTTEINDTIIYRCPTANYHIKENKYGYELVAIRLNRKI